MPSTQTNLLLLSRLLRTIFAAQARDVASRLTLDGPTPSLGHWVDVTARAVKPLLLQMWQHGAARTLAQLAGISRPATQVEPVLYSIAGADGGRSYSPGNDSIFGSAKEVMSPEAEGYVVRDLQCSSHCTRDVSQARFAVAKAKGGGGKGAGPTLPPLVVSFDRNTTSRLRDAVDAAALRFCTETNETATRELKQAVEALRRLLKRGLGQDVAVAVLAKKVQRIFNDPYRAYRIAATESVRAVAGGQLLAAEDSGVVRGKRWLRSADPCELCKSISTRKVFKLDEPFYVDPKGGTYSVCKTPPLHPHCQCDQEMVV